jgi:hypothetical protein
MSTIAFYEGPESLPQHISGSGFTFPDGENLPSTGFELFCIAPVAGNVGFEHSPARQPGDTKRTGGHVQPAVTRSQKHRQRRTMSYRSGRRIRLRDHLIGPTVLK